ncbi:SDR family NAD(P)-dependent oxidoreductase [Rhizosaccharibacter radicis]|uniref:SDR family NAD(P)-dependent oxidoreductase n=1 Tax=Rhizosaccharibacter radicis TaxID=2782605 RepID=A0ABT1VWS1_9PROT|nr:SDR family NAD(P)-dependent oxidoreductase [Acetobacteraceae bacterium KSS12]
MSLFILTGASRGLGAALAARLLRDGHEVVAIARGDDPGLAAGSGRLHWIRRDLGALDGLAGWMAELMGSFAAQPSRLILNAGMIEPIAAASALDDGAVEEHLRVNLASPMLLASGFLRATANAPHERRLMAISSGAARRGVPHWSAYCAAKAGLDNFIRSVNAETAHQPDAAPLRAASVAPGVVDTAMQATLRATPFPGDGRFHELHQTGGLSSPDDAAAKLLVLLERDDFGDREIADIRDA